MAAFLNARERAVLDAMDIPVWIARQPAEEQGTAELAQDACAAVLDQDDPATVRDGAPAYLIALDGMIAGSPVSLTISRASSTDLA